MELRFLSGKLQILIHSPFEGEDSRWVDVPSVEPEKSLSTKFVEACKEGFGLGNVIVTGVDFEALARIARMHFENKS